MISLTFDNSTAINETKTGLSSTAKPRLRGESVNRAVETSYSLLLHRNETRKYYKIHFSLS